MDDRNEEILNKQFVMTGAGRIDRIRDLYTTFNPQVDLQALCDKGYVEAVDRMMEAVTMSLDDHDPKVIAYWAKQGMVKEFHGENTPVSWSEYEAKTGYHWVENEKEAAQNFRRLWTSFVPVSAFRPENADRKYPAVVVLHGGFNPSSIIDGWGFPQEAARREWIVIVPSLEVPEILAGILEEAESLYPIDKERVYITGFSYGGFMTDQNALQHTELYAVAGVCGAPIGTMDLHPLMITGMEPMPPLDWKSSALEKKMYMPIMNVYGNLDGNRFPFYGIEKEHDDPFETTTESVIDGINLWCRINQADEVDVQTVRDLKGRTDISTEEKEIGMPLAPQYRRTVVADGVTNYIGDIPSRDGIVRIRIMCEMNMPHWPTPEMIRQLYDFFSHFRRDTQTGESIYEA